MTVAAVHIGDLVRVLVKARGRPPSEVLARWQGLDAETGLAMLAPLDRVGRLYVDPEHEIRALHIVEPKDGAR